MTMMMTTSTRLSKNYCCLLSLILLLFHNGSAFTITSLSGGRFRSAILSSLSPSSHASSSPFATATATTPISSLKGASIDSDTAAGSGAIDSSDSSEEDDNDDEILWNRAKDFAFAEIPDDYHTEYMCSETSLKEARYLLKQAIYLQSGCVTGTITSNEICDESNAAEAAMVVSQLRHKIQRLEALEERAKHPHSSPPSDSVVPLVATELALGAMVVVVIVFWTTLEIGLQQGDDFIPPQDIHDWWSSFVHHFL